MITKLEVIRRHTNFAIRGLFSEEDHLPLITVASAAFQIARDLAELEGVGKLHKSFKALVGPEHEKKLWLAFNKTANYLKHADKDPNGTMSIENDDMLDVLILMPCYYYYELEGRLSEEMSAYTKWFSVSTPEFSRMYNINDNAPPIQEFRALSRSERLKYGQSFLHGESHV